MFVRQLFGPNLEVLWGTTPPKVKFSSNQHKVETHNVGSCLRDNCLDQI